MRDAMRVVVNRDWMKAIEKNVEIHDLSRGSKTLDAAVSVWYRAQTEYPDTVTG